MSDRVVVRAPATVANLGPGFDCLGLALAWHDEIKVERHDTLEITASGLGADGIRRDASNSIVQGLSAVLGEEPTVRIHKMTAVAFARGFGSSAISIVAGLLAGRSLGDTAHSTEDLVASASALEGHADNVAPCLLGGITVAAGGAVARLEPPAWLRVLVCIAPGTLATTAARAALPEQVPHADAVENLGRAALLTAAIAGDRPDLLMAATEDRLHQPARFGLMPDTGSLVGRLRTGGVAAFLSGAGPSVAALVTDEAATSAEELARASSAEGWEIRVLSVDREGARVVEERDRT